MSGARNLTADVDIDLKGLFGAIWRKKFLIALLTLIGGALIFVSVSMEGIISQIQIFKCIRHRSQRRALLENLLPAAAERR
mgnify:CR=1 FL=1